MLVFFGMIMLLLAASLSKAAPTSSGSSLVCTTEWAPTPNGPVLTVTRRETETTSKFIVSTITPVTTETPSPTTVTIVQTEVNLITVPQVVRTISERTTTTVILSTTTLTTTSFNSDVMPPETVLIYPTTTIETYSGWLKPTVPPLPKRRDLKMAGRIDQNAAIIHAFNVSLEGRPLREAVKFYKRAPVPTKVVCTDLRTVTVDWHRTVTGSSTLTIVAAQPTETIHRTLSKVTTIVPPDGLAATTLTVTAPVISTDWVTETKELAVPQTVTEMAPLATVYAACLPPNLLQIVRGEGIAMTWEGPGLHGRLNFDAETPYDCCAACIMHPGCGGTSFRPHMKVGGGGKCTGMQAKRETGCSQLDQMADLIGYFDNAGPGVPPLGGLTVSNGLCGRWELGNRFGNAWGGTHNPDFPND